MSQANFSAYFDHNSININFLWFLSFSKEQKREKELRMPLEIKVTIERQAKL
jgi:hypothetical protein